MTKKKIPESDYYHARAIQEQVAAQVATCDAARRRHEELATAYRFREMMTKTAPCFHCDSGTGDPFETFRLSRGGG